MEGTLNSCSRGSYVPRVWGGGKLQAWGRGMVHRPKEGTKLRCSGASDRSLRSLRRGQPSRLERGMAVGQEPPACLPNLCRFGAHDVRGYRRA